MKNKRYTIKTNDKVKLYDLLNDEHKNHLWGLRFLRLEKIWEDVCVEDIKKMKIAIIDSGIDRSHEDLRNINFLSGYNFIDKNNDITDNYFHGTAIAGIIAAEKNNHIGIAGVCSGVTILPLKVLNKKGKAKIEHVLDAIEVAIENEVDIINISMGYERGLLLKNNNHISQREYDLIKTASKKNIAIVSAVGNNFGLPMDYPASMKEVFSVASYGISGLNLEIFNPTHNAKTDKETLFAPGIGIYTTIPNSCYTHLNGSSFATAFVSGAIVLLKAMFKHISLNDIRSGLLAGCDVLNIHNQRMNILNVDKSYDLLSQSTLNII